MSATAVRVGCCDERLCVDDDTVTVQFPGGTQREYCREHLPTVLELTRAEVVA